MSYDFPLKILRYDYTSDKLSFPLFFRERHFTEDTDSALLQGIGPELQIAVWSERDNVLVRCPLSEWTETSSYKVSFGGSNKGIINVGKFEDVLIHESNIIDAEVTIINEFEQT